MKLSDKLSALIDKLGLMYGDYDVVVEAIVLAKRYEDAPVGFVMGQGLLTEGTAAIVQTEKPGDLKGQRVRIIREEAGGGRDG